MSMRDTIAAARREARDAGGLFAGEADKDSADDARSHARRSAARAKPARDAAATVRVVSAADAKVGRSGKAASEMTREERKAERETQRTAEDRRAAAATVLLQRQDDYRHHQRVWWIMLGVGFALTIVSFVLTRAFPLGTDGSNTLPSIVAIVVLVLAYVLIIVAFVYDWRKVRPLRKAADAEANRLTDKRVRRILQEDADERAAKKAARKARRG